MKLQKNIEDCIFEKLSKDAQIFKKAKYFLVDFTLDSEYCEKWIISHDEFSVSHKNVFKISGQSFYDLISKEKDSLKLINELVTEVLNDVRIEK